jgi:tetratricopeptide (TPR) repeat protein
LVLFVAGTASAAPAPLWDDILHPNRARCAELTEQASRVLDGSRDAERAGAPLERAVRLCPDSAEVLALLGKQRVLIADYAAARPILERARILSPDDRDGELAFYLGLSRALTGDLPGAIAEYRRAETLGRTRDAWMLQYDLGDALMALGRLAEAVPAYRRATELAPNEIMPRYALAVALERDGQLEESRRALNLALGGDPHFLHLRSPRFVFLPTEDRHYYLFLVHQARGHTTEARAELEDFIRSAPNSPYLSHARELLEASRPSPSPDGSRKGETVQKAAKSSRDAPRK